MKDNVFSYAPPFMSSQTESPRSSVVPVEGKDYSYDRNQQVAIFKNNTSSTPTGYATDQGNDWTTTDHV